MGEVREIDESVSQEPSSTDVSNIESNLLAISTASNSEDDLEVGVLPEYIGSTLTSTDGRIVVPHISNCSSWSFHSPWMTRANPSVWMKKHLNASDRSRAVDGIFSPLVDFLVHTTKTLMVDLSSEQGKRALTTTREFQVKADVMKIVFDDESRLDALGEGAGKIFPTCCTAHLTTLLLDKLMWAYDLRNKGAGMTVICLDNETLPVVPYDKSSVDEKKKKKIDALIELHKRTTVDWKTTVLDFISAWNQSRSEIPGPQQHAFNTLSETNPAQFIKNLYEASERQYTSAKLGRVMSRFHDTVMALTSYRLFNLKQALEDQENKVRAKFHFHKAILAICGKTATPLDNAQFMRPLLSIAAAGPIALLDGTNMNPRGTTGWSLMQLTQISMLGPGEENLEKLAIESDILNLLIDASVEGADLIQLRMDGLVKKWSESLGLIRPSPSNSLAVGGPHSAQNKTKAGTQKLVIRKALKMTLSKPLGHGGFSDAVKKEMKVASERVKKEIEEATELAKMNAQKSVQSEVQSDIIESAPSPSSSEGTDEPAWTPTYGPGIPSDPSTIPFSSKFDDKKRKRPSSPGVDGETEETAAKRGKLDDDAASLTDVMLASEPPTDNDATMDVDQVEAVNNEPAKVPDIGATNEGSEVPTNECSGKEVEKEEREVSKESAGQGDEPLLGKEQPTCQSSEAHDASTVDLDTLERPEDEAATVVDEVRTNEGDNEPMDQDTVDQSDEVETAASVLEGELGGRNDEEPGSPLTTDNGDDAGEGEEEKEEDKSEDGEDEKEEEEPGDEEGMDEEDPGDIDVEVEIENEKPKPKAKAKARAKKTVVAVEPSRKSSRIVEKAIVEKAKEASETQKQREPTSEPAKAAPRRTPKPSRPAAKPTAKAAPGNSRLLFSKDDIEKTFSGLDAVFDRPLWRIKESDIFLEPDVVLRMNLFAPEVCKPEPVPNAPPPPQGETPKCDTQSAPVAPPESPSNPQPLDTQPPSETPVPAGDQPPNEAPTPAPTPNQTQSDTPAPAPATTPNPKCNVGVQATDTERCIQWKQRALEIPIPTTRHDMMFELVRIWDSMSGRHEQDSFELEAEDKLRVFTRKDWEQVNDEERLALFGNVNVVVKKEKNSSDKTPEHVFPEITRWDRREIAKAFDLYAPRFMYEQSWVSDQVRKRVADPEAKDPIPRYKLIDDGTWSAINRWLNEDKLKGPMFPEIVEPGPWKLGEPQPREDVTLGQTNDNPQLRMRCGMLNQLLENRVRYQKRREELIEEAAKEIASAASEEAPTAEAAKEKASGAPGETPTAEAAKEKASGATGETPTAEAAKEKTSGVPEETPTAEAAKEKTSAASEETPAAKDAIPSAALQQATLAFNYLLHAFPALVNFLDIPLSASVNYSLPIGGLEGFPNLQSQNNPVKPFATESPTLDMRWGLFASGGAVTNAHTDAAGLATYLYIKLGRKLWFIGIPTSYMPEATVINSEQELRLTDAVAQLRRKKRRMMEKNAKEGDAKEGDATEGDATEDGEKFERLNAFPLKRTIEGNEYMPYVSTHRGFEIGALRWVVVMLEPGDELYMQPGTVHFVISTEDCIAVGGHFYSPATLDKTMMSLVTERYVAPQTTNTAHSRCGVLFLRMLSYLVYVFKNNGDKGSDAVWTPSSEQLAHIFVIASYLDQLAPDPFDEDTTDDIDPVSEDDESKDDDEASATEEAEKPKRKRKPKKPVVVSIDSKHSSATLDLNKLPETWQHTKEFEHDFGYATLTLIPTVIRLATTRYPDIVRQISAVQDTLLRYSKAFDDQLAHLNRLKGWEVRDPIKRSEKLTDLLKNLLTEADLKIMREERQREKKQTPKVVEGKHDLTGLDQS
ncbi:hypothetical protein SCHPADRAFT_895409 [Schizopora paradoxa]|uniref:JmjC domain-containing protein n=1 Tax=Schizopora paradoxa TaxID=27342 RepID=A0A0H2R3R1_9AGAM|nr:hypothetical protein SCHPADRAFT_895409 [Schizopora paradoxa]